MAHLRIVLAGAAVAASLAAEPAHAATFTVTNTNATGAGSLKAAIEAANATTAADQVVFAIPGLGVKKIPAGLPAITHGLTIDGYSQPGSSANTRSNGTSDAVLRIELDGTGIVLAGQPVVRVSASKVTIKGVAIMGIPKTGSGIAIDADVEIVRIEGCHIGTNAAATTDGSSGYGIVNRGSATIGGPAPAQANLISANDAAGVHQLGPATKIQRNIVGVDTSFGTLANGTGILVEGPDADGILIGGRPGNGNTIVRNTGRGVSVRSTVTGVVAIEANRMLDNGALGIDLGHDGVTPNDEGDADEGPNGLQNYPVLTFATATPARVRVEGRLDSKPGQYDVEFFSNGLLDPSGFGEGTKYLGHVVVVVPADATDPVPFSTAIDADVANHASITATATGSEGTSEFARSTEMFRVTSSLVVESGNDDGPGSLRAALDAANADPDVNEIVFAGPPGKLTIAASLTHAAFERVIIDGYSKPGASPNTSETATNAKLLVELDGSAASSGSAGLQIASSFVIVRGLVVRDFPRSGILLLDNLPNRVRVEGNFVGTDTTGMFAAGNGSGIRVEHGFFTTIGGIDRSQRNLVSGNGLNGIHDRGFFTDIVGNLVGTDAKGSGVLGNAENGILVAGDDDEAGLGARSTIGGDTGHGNVIAGNARDGVRVIGEHGFARVTDNAIRSNGGLGINLSPTEDPEGVTPNDADDIDSGPSSLQNFPILTAAIDGPLSIRFRGTLDVPPGPEQSYEIHVYRVTACDESGHGEGAIPLGSESVFLSDDEEDFELTVGAESTLVLNPTYTATATADEGNVTSEFSPCFSPPQALCGDANQDGALTAADALVALSAAVGNGACLGCLCDVNGSGDITTGDALAILRKAVGIEVDLICETCA